MQDTNKNDYFGIVVKSARQTKGLTQVQLAEVLFISLRYLKAIENSGRKPSYDLLARIVWELQIPADTIFCSESEGNSTSAKIIDFQKIT